MASFFLVAGFLGGGAIQLAAAKQISTVNVASYVHCIPADSVCAPDEFAGMDLKALSKVEI